jgi:hypothetical protein
MEVFQHLAIVAGAVLIQFIMIVLPEWQGDLACLPALRTHGV